MVQRVGGFRRKTRNKLKKDIRKKGKISLTDYFRKFSEGELVCLVAEPSIQKGMYFPRFHGKQGKVQKQKGNCYEVLIKDGNKSKKVLVHPVHLKKV